MEPTNIIERGPITLAGMSFFGDPFESSGGWTEENAIGQIWQRFMTFWKTHAQEIQHVRHPNLAYEVHIEHPETREKGQREVFVGIEIKDICDLPVELVVKVLPATTYAVFTLNGDEIDGDWPLAIYQDWLPASEYENAHGFMIELYDERYKGLDLLAESAIDIYVPVKRRG